MYIRAPKPLQARMRSVMYLRAANEQISRGTYIPEVRFLQPTLDDSRGRFVIFRHEFTADNRSADDFGGIDDFLDPGDTESHVHRCYPREVECF